MVAHYACHASRIIFFRQKTMDRCFPSLRLSSFPVPSSSPPPILCSLLIVWDGRMNARLRYAVGVGGVVIGINDCFRESRPFFYFSDGEDEAVRYQSEPLLCHLNSRRVHCTLSAPEIDNHFPSFLSDLCHSSLLPFPFCQSICKSDDDEEERTSPPPLHWQSSPLRRPMRSDQN